tara:strand:+ start:73 stop:492 length:420 start_codon:yes stop_codon:yes gene_type:complete
MEKFLYFRNVTAVADDDNIEDSVTFKASALIGMFPSGDEELKLTFKNIQRPEGHGNSLVLDNAANLPLVDTVLLNVNANSHREVMQAIAGAVNSAGAINDPFIVVADDATDDNNASAITLHRDITSCGTITHNAAYVNA